MRASFVSLLLLASCSSVPPADHDAGEAPFRIPVSIAASEMITFQSEIADTPDERTKGLMFREALGEREGMIFLFAQPMHQSFWMRNTLIPLDMIFIQADSTILGIVENAEPKTDVPRSVPGDSQFVLEIKGGLSKQLGLAAGQHVTFLAPIPSR